MMQFYIKSVNQKFFIYKVIVESAYLRRAITELLLETEMLKSSSLLLEDDVPLFWREKVLLREESE
jgi:hypothetical protein